MADHCLLRRTIPASASADEEPLAPEDVSDFQALLLPIAVHAISVRFQERLLIPRIDGVDTRS